MHVADADMAYHMHAPSPLARRPSPLAEAAPTRGVAAVQAQLDTRSLFTLLSSLFISASVHPEH